MRNIQQTPGCTGVGTTDPWFQMPEWVQNLFSNASKPSTEVQPEKVVVVEERRCPKGRIVVTEVTRSVSLDIY